MGVSAQRHAPATLPPVKTRYPFYSRLGEPQGKENPSPTGIRSTVRPIRSKSLYRLSYPGPHSHYELQSLYY